MIEFRKLNQALILPAALLAIAASAASADLIRVMPLGDSITDGYTIPGGSRTQLWNESINNGQLIEFVGSQYNGPSWLASHHHEGHPGWIISDIAGQVDGWMASASPQIVLLQIGTNDINMNRDPGGAPGRLSALIDQICARLPAGGKLFVAQITPESNADWNQQIINYNNQIPGIVQSK